MWPSDLKFGYRPNQTESDRADILIECLKAKSSFDDFFSLGADLFGKQGQAEKIYKVSETTIDNYQGTYYGEQSFNINYTGFNQPHGKGVFVDKEGWVWVRYFDRGSRLHNGRFIQINPVTKVMKISTRRMQADGTWKTECKEFNKEGQIISK